MDERPDDRRQRSDLPGVSALSPGALSLLAVAAGAIDDRTGERRYDFVDGAALRRCWQTCGELPSQCKSYCNDEPNDLLKWMDAESPPPNLFLFCGWLADAIHNEICGRRVYFHRRPGDRTSGFDHSVYLALGQALSHFCGMERGVGPEFKELIREVARLDPADLQRMFLRNYIGNILQDYFDQAGVRLAHPDLPPSTESDLRRVDAERFAQIVFSDAEHSTGPLSWARLNTSLKRVIGAVVLAERELDD